MFFSVPGRTASGARLTAIVLASCLRTDLACGRGLGQAEDQFTPKQRIARIHELGKRHGDAIAALSAYLNDGDREIRVEAVKAIVKIGGEDSLTPLAKATQDSDSETAIRATDGVTNYYVPGYVAKGLTGPLTRGLRQTKSFFASRNDQVIDPAVLIRDDVGQALAKEITAGESDDARANASRAAGILRDRAAVPALANSLRVLDSQTILESLVALQKIKDPSSCPAVAPVIRDLDPRVKIAALQTAGLLRCLPVAPEVREALKAARDAKLRRAALSALASLGIPEDRSTFQQYLHNEDGDLRAAALEGLGRIREPDDFPALEAAYNEPGAGDPVHLAAAFAMVSEGKVDTGEYSPLPYLIEKLGTRAQTDAAGDYLTELARRKEVETGILDELKRANRDQKLALCSVLGESGSEQSLPALKNLTQDIDPEVALAAGRALKRLGAQQTNS